jgi:anti-anti-sigma factor
MGRCAHTMLEWSLEPSPVAFVLRSRGEVDLASAPEFRRALSAAEQTGRHVIVDLSAIAYLDLHGLRAIDDARRQVVARGRRLVVAAPSATLQKIIRLLALDLPADSGPNRSPILVNPDH